MNNVATKCSDKTMLAKRPTHALNDALVRLAVGATQTPRFKHGATLASGSDAIGIVWAVAGGNAVVHFGMFSGHDVLVFVAEKDLVLA